MYVRRKTVVEGQTIEYSARVEFVEHVHRLIMQGWSDVQETTDVTAFKHAVESRFDCGLLTQIGASGEAIQTALSDVNGQSASEMYAGFVNRLFSEVGE